MTDLIENAFKHDLRLDKWTREELRKSIQDGSGRQRFSRAVSDVLRAAKGSDPHVLEDHYLLGVAVRDVVRGPMSLAIETVSMPIVAFVYGFTDEPFDHVFETRATEEVRRHLFGKTEPARISGSMKASHGRRAPERKSAALETTAGKTGAQPVKSVDIAIELLH
ncbi:hypothetical protein EJC49_18765 [Aquibium carbonis]|uniref:Uncharacterized protein n=1 Tax=Aquibium carbonis TaxID=2495581 RepID=A0A3R9Y7D4_9HYPH|nr:hypothetical protein [Aquibium carbonis]RST84806.1 hypothetical protein EJC49_18765 [Aquibium carbonis]